MNRREVERMMRTIRAAKPDGVYRCQACGGEVPRLDIDPETWWHACGGPGSPANGRMVAVRPERVR